MVNAHPLPGKRPDYYNQKSEKQNVHSKHLPFRLNSTNQWPDEKAGREPGSCDPEKSQLHMPRSRDAIRKPAIQRNTVKASSLDSVVSRNQSAEDLYENKRGYNPEVFQSGTL